MELCKPTVCLLSYVWVRLPVQGNVFYPQINLLNVLLIYQIQSLFTEILEDLQSTHKMNTNETVVKFVFLSCDYHI